MQDMSLGQLAVLGRGRGGWCSELSSGVGLEIWEGDVSPETLWEPLSDWRTSEGGGGGKEGRKSGRGECGEEERGWEPYGTETPWWALSFDQVSTAGLPGAA